MATEYVPYGGQIVTLRDARAHGAGSYFTGIPCVHGHVSQRSVADGKCRECRRAIEQARRVAKADLLNAARRAARAKNPERFREIENAYWLSHPEKRKAKAKVQRERHAEKIKARNRIWRETNSTKIRADKKAHYEATREHVAVIVKKWRKANPEKCRAYLRARRAREKKAEGSHTHEDVERIYRLQRGKCAGCKAALNHKYQVDHIVALSNGGSNNASNLQLLCRTCNRSKTDKDPIIWAQDCGWLL